MNRRKRKKQAGRYLTMCMEGEEEYDACNFFAKRLKSEGYSLYGWKLYEVPAL